jgi:hypothetical protein
MSDNLQKRGGQDRQRINVGEDYELRDWAKKFGVSEEELKAAVQAVGDRAGAVEKRLNSAGRSGSERPGGASERKPPRRAG